MPDPLHWLGVTKIHRFISMSDMKVRTRTRNDAGPEDRGARPRCWNRSPCGIARPSISLIYASTPHTAAAQYDAITKSGIAIVERVPIPPELVPKDAAVEISAKVRGCVNYIVRSA